MESEDKFFKLLPRVLLHANPQELKAQTILYNMTFPPHVGAFFRYIWFSCVHSLCFGLHVLHVQQGGKGYKHTMRH